MLVRKLESSEGVGSGEDMEKGRCMAKKVEIAMSAGCKWPVEGTKGMPDHFGAAAAVDVEAACSSGTAAGTLGTFLLLLLLPLTADLETFFDGGCLLDEPSAGLDGFEEELLL